MFKQFYLLLLMSCFSVYACEMTVEEKVGQLLIAHFHGKRANEEAEKLIKEAHIGGFIYYNWANGLESPEQVKQLSEELQTLAKIPLFICIDQEGEPVNRLKDGFSTYPGNRDIAAQGLAFIAEENACMVGKQLHSLGINMNLAPVVDVSTYPETSYIASRTFGNNPHIVIHFAEAALKGYQNACIISVLKHFPGYGEVEIDPHAGLPILHKTRHAMEQVELLPFRKLADQAPAIMTAHIKIPALDEHRCATLSKIIIQDILRNDIGYDGLVITDSLAMAGLIANTGSLEEAAIEAILAGCDIVLLGGKSLNQGNKEIELSVDDVLKIHSALVRAVNTKIIPMERIEASLARIFNLKARLVVQVPLGNRALITNID